MHLLDQQNLLSLLAIAVAIVTIFFYFNTRVGPALWDVKKLRPTLRALEATKLIWPPLIGGFLALVPLVPRPTILEGQPLSVRIFAYFVIGVHCQWIVKGGKKMLEARGIDIELDLPPVEQKKQGLLK